MMKSFYKLFLCVYATMFVIQYAVYAMELDETVRFMVENMLPAIANFNEGPVSNAAIPYITRKVVEQCNYEQLRKEIKQHSFGTEGAGAIPFTIQCDVTNDGSALARIVFEAVKKRNDMSFITQVVFGEPFLLTGRCNFDSNMYRWIQWKKIENVDISTRVQVILYCTHKKLLLSFLAVAWKQLLEDENLS